MSPKAGVKKQKKEEESDPTDEHPGPQPINPQLVGEREKILLYGMPGMGKTFAALTAPGPIYYLTIGGANELKTYYSGQFQRKHGKKEIFVDVAKERLGKEGKFEMGKAPRGFDHACELMDAALELDDRGKLEFDTIVIDNATILAEYQMFKTMYLSSQDSQKDKTYDKFIKSGILAPADYDYKGAMSLMQQWIFWLYEVDKNLIIIAHEHETWKQNTQSRHEKELVGVKPQFIGKLRTILPNKFDNVWRMYRQGQMYVARTEAQGNPFEILAKSRIGEVISSDYADPNISDVIDQYKIHAAKF